MPKINVYLPDQLAADVKFANLSVSRICQDALRNALFATANAEIAVGHGTVEPVSEVPLGMHVSAMFACAVDTAAARGAVEVEVTDLLRGLVAEGGSLTLLLIEQNGVSRDSIVAELDSRDPLPDKNVNSITAPERLSDELQALADSACAEALAQAAAAVDGVHIVKALLDDQGAAGDTLRALGIDRIFTETFEVAVRGAVLYGRATERHSSPTVVMLSTMAARLERIESVLGDVLNKSAQSEFK